MNNGKTHRLHVTKKATCEVIRLYVHVGVGCTLPTDDCQSNLIAAFYCASLNQPLNLRSIVVDGGDNVVGLWV